MKVMAITDCDNFHFRVFQNIKPSYTDFSFENKLVYTVMTQISKRVKYVVLSFLKFRIITIIILMQHNH